MNIRTRGRAAFLLAMGKAAGGGDRKTALKMARALRERHYDTAGELLGTALFTEFHGDLGADFEDLDELLRGIGENTAHGKMPIFQSPDEVERLVSGDTAADDHGYAGLSSRNKGMRAV